MKYFHIIFIFLCISCNNYKKPTTSRKSKIEIFTDENSSFIIHDKKTIYSTSPFPIKLDYFDSFYIKSDFNYNVYCNDSVIRIVGKRYEKKFQKLKIKEMLRDVDSIKIEKFKIMKSELQGKFFILEYGGVFDLKNSLSIDLISGIKMKLESDDKQTLKDYVDFMDFKFVEKNKIRNSDSTWKYIFTLYEKNKKRYLISDNQNLYNFLIYFCLKYEFNDLVLYDDIIEEYKNRILFDVEIKPLK